MEGKPFFQAMIQGVLLNGDALLTLQEFDDPRDAEDAVYELDGKELCNER